MDHDKRNKYYLNYRREFLGRLYVMDIGTPKCEKKSFESKHIATKRAQEINGDKEVKRQNFSFRAYLCPLCSKYHLTKMELSLARWINDIAYRNKVREEAFVRREVKHYNKRNNIRE